MGSEMKRWLTILAAVLVLAGATAWLARDWLEAQVYLRILEWDGRVEGLQVDRVVDGPAPHAGHARCGCRGRHRAVLLAFGTQGRQRRRRLRR